jgi:hypothetical protein
VSDFDAKEYDFEAEAMVRRSDVRKYKALKEQVTLLAESLAQHNQRIIALETENLQLRDQVETLGRRSSGIDTSPEAMERYFAPVVERAFAPGEPVVPEPIKHGRITRREPKGKAR